MTPQVTNLPFKKKIKKPNIQPPKKENTSLYKDWMILNQANFGLKPVCLSVKYTYYIGQGNNS